MVLILNNRTAIWKHQAGFQSFNATAKLSFEDTVDAQYFIDNFNGQHDFRDAMPDGKDVHFTVYLQTGGAEFADKMVKVQH